MSNKYEVEIKIVGEDGDVRTSVKLKDVNALNTEYVVYATISILNSIINKNMLNEKGKKEKKNHEPNNIRSTKERSDKSEKL